MFKGGIPGYFFMSFRNWTKVSKNTTLNSEISFLFCQILLSWLWDHLTIAAKKVPRQWKDLSFPDVTENTPSYCSEESHGAMVTIRVEGRINEICGIYRKEGALYIYVPFCFKFIYGEEVSKDLYADALFSLTRVAKYSGTPAWMSKYIYIYI